jgi:hypothetical protein
MDSGEVLAVHIGANTTLDDESESWLRDLSASGARRAIGQRRLHELLLRVAQHELNRRAPRTLVTGPEADDLTHQAAADAMVAILAKLPTFRGESRLTTWAYRFVILEVSTKLGRQPPAQQPRRLVAGRGMGAAARPIRLRPGRPGRSS